MSEIITLRRTVKNEVNVLLSVLKNNGQQQFMHIVHNRATDKYQMIIGNPGLYIGASEYDTIEEAVTAVRQSVREGKIRDYSVIRYGRIYEFKRDETDGAV